MPIITGTFTDVQNAVNKLKLRPGTKRYAESILLRGRIEGDTTIVCPPNRECLNIYGEADTELIQHGKDPIFQVDSNHIVQFHHFAMKSEYSGSEQAEPFIVSNNCTWNEIKNMSIICKDVAIRLTRNKPDIDWTGSYLSYLNIEGDPDIKGVGAIQMIGTSSGRWAKVCLYRSRISNMIESAFHIECVKWPYINTTEFENCGIGIHVVDMNYPQMKDDWRGNTFVNCGADVIIE